MIKKYSLLTLILFLFVHTAYSQLSDLHYLPPLKQINNNQAIRQQAFYLSSPETLAFPVQIFQGTGTVPIATVIVSNGSPGRYDLADGDNNITLVTNANTGTVLSNSGLRFFAPGGQKFYVNYRGRSSAQATSLTSKGRQALGLKFKWGGIPNRANNGNLTTTLGIMATEDNTTVTISGYDPDCEFRLGNAAGGITSNTIEITLNAGQSYVVEALKNQTNANIDGWLGATITADKKIAISNGGLNVGIRTGSGSRDAAIDQPVPQNIVGRDYVFVRGNGTNETEFPIIIGTQNGTDIFVNGSTTPIATINDGEYFEIPGSNYSSGSIGANMTVITSKEAYAYQCLAGSSGIQTIGLNFIAPVNCLLPDNLSNIPDIRDVDNLDFTGGITILASTATPNENITVTDGSGIVALPTPINASGLPWKSFFVSNLTGNVSVQSTGPIAVGFIGVNSNAGIAGYFSGFDTVPVVDLTITGGGCLPGSDITETSGTFDAYQWYKDGAIIPGATSSSYTPLSPGDFYVKVTKGGCTYDSSILSAYNCDPEIVLTKTVDKSDVIEGDTVIFKVSVKSLGVNPVTNLVINDLLPAELSFVSATAVRGTWNAPNWNVGTMTSGQVFNIFITAKVNEVSASSTVINTVSNTQDIAEADVQLDDDTEPINITNSSMEVIKTSLPAADGNYDTLGELINYSIIVKNTGDTVLNNITITDPKADAGSISPSSVATLAVGASATFTATHKITQANIDAGKVTNQATAKATLSNGFEIFDISDDPDDLNNNSDDPTITPIVQTGKLLLEKIADPADDGLYDSLGEIINYELFVKNTGNTTLNNITITDPNANTGSITPATLASLAPGASYIFTAKHTIVQADFNAGKVSNIATVTGTIPVNGTVVSDQSDDPATLAPNDATVVSVPEVGRLAATKEDITPAGTVLNTVGQVITYRIVVQSTGTITLTDLNIVDPNADSITLQSTTGTDTNTSDNRVDSIDPSQTATFIATHTITQNDLDNGKVTNRATASALDTTPASVTDITDDPNNPNNAIDDPTVTPLVATPSLSITKTVNDDSNVANAQVLTYTYTVTNNGNITIDAVTISDIHNGTGTLSTPALQSTTGTDDDITDNEIETLAPGQTGIWTATYTVTTADITNQIDITNTVTATGKPRINPLTNTTANATKSVTVHPTDAICSNITLSHNLITDGPYTGATFSWLAVPNDEITGLSTNSQSTTEIDDQLINTSGVDQTVQYNITVSNPSGTIIDSYKYVVTVYSQLEVPEDDEIIVECAAEIIEPEAPIVLDYKGTSILPVKTSTATGDQSCEGTKKYTFEYTDCGGNVATYNYTYVIDRTIPPATVPANGASTVECIDDATPPTPPAGIKDVCGTAITAILLSTVDSPSSLTCEGTRTYNYTFTDCSGLVSNWKYVYTIDKTTVPVVPADAGSTVECLAGAVQPATPTVTDQCGNDIIPVITESTDPTCEGTKVYTFTYTDCASNVSVYTYTYTIDLTIKPVVPADTGSTVECIADAVQPATPAVTDQCGNTLTPVITASADPTCEGTKVYTYTYTDCASNVSVYTYTYTIDLTTKPIVPADAGSTVECLADAVQPATPTVTDQCGNDIIPVITESTDPTCEGTKVYTFTYTNCASNVSAYTYTYTIDLTTKPVVPVNAGSTVNDISKAVQPTAPTVIDNCGKIIIPVITENSSPVCDGTKIYTFTYTDCAGNSDVYIYTYQIDVTSTLVISNKIRTACSNLSLNYDLKAVTPLVNPTFQWSVIDNPNVTGENSSSGTLLNDILINKTGFVQTVKYTVTPFNNKGCEGPTFDITVTVNPEPFVAIMPTKTSCSNIPLSHDLNADVNVAGANFKWAAVNNPNVSGATTTVNSNATITDTLINTTGVVQTVIYKITPESIKGCTGAEYTYTVTVSPEAKLLVTKTTLAATDGAYDSFGEVINYQITVENPNEVALNNLSVTDINADANSISPLTVPAVAAFSKVVFTASHTITQADLDAGFVDNSATGTAFDPCGTIVIDSSDDPTTAAANDATRTIVVQKPVIALEKTFLFNDENGDGITQLNETITYLFKVKNTGNVTMTGIQITDPLITVNGGPINLAPAATDDTTFFGTYTLTQGVIDAGSLTNSAIVTAVDTKGNEISDISDDPKDNTNADTNGNGNPDDSTIFTIVSKPELTLKKSGVFIDANNDGLAQAGEKIEYTFDVTNTGNVTMSGITIGDPLTAVIGGPVKLIPGQTNSSTFTAIYTLSQADVNNGTVINTATASGKAPDGSTITDASDDPSTIADNDATVTKLTQDAQMTLLKTSVFKDENGNGFPEVGETIDYIFNVKNNGNVTLNDINISDPLLTISGGPITLLPNKSDLVTFKGSYTLTLNDINVGTVINSATATAKDPNGDAVIALSDDPTNPSNVDTNGDGHPDDKTVTKLKSNPKLSVSKTGIFNDRNTDGIAQVGEQITYTFDVKNIGNVTVSNITITDALVIVSGGPITLNPTQNDTTTFTASYTIKQSDIDAGIVTNTAIASGVSPNGAIVKDTSDDPNNGTNQDINGNGEPDDATVTPLPGKGIISLIKVALAPADGAYDTVGEAINYKLTVTNTGNLTLTNVIVTDTNADNGSILPAVIATIAPGASAIVNAKHTLTLADINSGGVTNSASVTSKDPFGNNITDISDDPNNTNDDDANADGDPDDATLTLVAQKPSLSLEKTATFNDENNDGLPQLNETITYNFKVSNTGNVSLSNVIVTDPLVTVSGGPISLLPGQNNSTTFFANYTITQANIDAGSIVNAATVNAKDPKGNTVSDTSDDPTNATNNDINGDGEPDDTTVTPLATKPQLTITKTGIFIDANNDGLAQAGETIKYQFDVSNSGNVTVSGITVTDARVTVTGGPITLLPKARNTTTFKAVYVLTQEDVDLGYVINTATASGKDPMGNIVSDKSDDPTTSAKNDDTTTTLARESQLSLFKTATFNDENGDGLPQANETINYKFDIRNNGNVTVFNVTITDPIVPVVGGPIDLSPAQIDDTTFTAIYTIKQSDIDSGSISNSAIATGQDRDGTVVTDVSDFSDDPDNPNDIDLNGDGDPDDPTVSSLTGKASLSLTKTATFNDLNANGFADLNETISYVFEVTNTGNLSINNILIADPLVTVTGNAIDLAPSQKDATTFTALYTITQADLDAGEITNSATVSGQDPNGNTVRDTSDDPENAANVDNNNDGNPDDATVTTFPVQGKINITKTALVAADGAYDTVGEKITYNMVITNTGSTTLTAVTVTDANADSGSIVPQITTGLAPGQSATVAATHTITQSDLNAGLVNNSATVSSKDKLGNTVLDISDDPTNPTNIDANADGDPDDVTVTAMVQKPVIALEKTFLFNDENGDGITQLNETITYLFKVKNTGNVTLTRIQITDPLITVNGGPINLAPAATDDTTFFGTYTLTQGVIDAGSLTNSAIVTAVDTKGNEISDISDDPKDNTNADTNGNGNPDDSTIFTIVSKPELTLKKSGVFIDANNDGLAQAGEKIEYTFDVTNTGNVTMSGITISDPLTAVVGGPIKLIPGQTNSSTFTAIYTLSQADVNNGTVVNTATATGKAPDGSTITDASDDPSTIADNDATVTKLTQDAQMTLLKTSVFKDENGNGFPEVGETIDYIFNVKNNGNVTLNDIKISDPLITISGGPITLLPNKSDLVTFKGSYTLTLNDINLGTVVNSATATAKDPNGDVVTALSDDPTNPSNVDTNGDGHPDDKTITKLKANPKLSVSKTGIFNDRNTDGIAQVGEQITYTFDVKNIGNVTVSNITITDALVIVSGGPITLNPTQNDTTTFTASYTIKQSDIDAGIVTNTAIASGVSPNGAIVKDTSDDPNNGTNQDINGNGEPDDATVTPLPGKGIISLIKVALAPADGAYDTVGEAINYKLTVTNTGNLTLTNVIVTDTNADNGSILPAVIATIAPGASAIVNAKHTLTLADINSGGVTNSASVTSKDPFGNNITDISDDPNNTNDDDANADGDPDDATLTLVAQKPSLSLEKTATFNDENNDGLPQLNETITYNFKVSNTGNVSLSNVIVTDPLVTVSGGPISLLPGQNNSTTFFANYTITQANIDAGSIVNAATVNAKDPKGNTVSDTSDDPTNATNNDINGDGEPDDTTVTPLATKPQLTITKTGIFIDANNDGLAQAGETIKYQFDVSNSGNVTVSGITVTDARVTVTGGPITLLPKARNTTTFKAVYVLTQEDVDLGYVINTATASGKDPMGNIVSDKSDDPTTSAKNDDTTTTLARESQLSLFKTATFNDENGDGLPQANETINYKFDIRNNGNVTVFNVTITDPIVPVVGGPIDLSPAQIDDTTFTAIYTIKQSDIDSGSISNSAIATGQDRDGTVVTDVSDFSDDPDNPNDIDLNGDGDPDDPTVSSLTGKASLSLTKTATFNDLNANGFADLNETISYVFEVTNTGNLSINNILIADPLVTVTGNAIDLAPSQKDATTFTALYTITQADLDAGEITNSATVSGQDPNGNTVRDTSDDPENAANVDNNNDGNPDDATVTTFPVQGKINITKTALVAADGAYDTVGEKITYNMVVINTGSTTLTAVTVTDANADSGSIVPQITTALAPGQSVNVLATHTITQTDLNTGLVNNSATVSSKDKLGNTVLDISDDPTNPTNIDANADGNPDDITVTAMVQKPKLALTKTATTAPDGLWDEVGEVILYNLTLTNTGNVTLTNVAVVDPNADNASVLPANFAKLEPGQKVFLTALHTITQNDLDAASVTNSATANALDPKGSAVSDLSDDPNNPANVDTNGNGNPDDATVTSIPQTATMDLTKVTATPRFTNLGDILTYTITVKNTGTVTLLNVVIQDANATFTSSATKSTLSPGASFATTAQHIVTAEDLIMGFVDNSAIATAMIPSSNVTVSEDSDDTNDSTNIDIDGDGDFEDPTSSYLDTDADGVADIIDIDDDNDGILDTVEGTNDSDGDGFVDSLDIDADNDGIPDNVEGQSTEAYIAPTGIDANLNGLDDAYEKGTTIGITPENTDGTDLPDYLDDDSDNDGITDTIEAFDKNHDGIPDLFLSGNDADHDGLDDSFEGSNTTDGFVVNNGLRNGSLDTNNTDLTDQPDYRDTDDDNDGVFTIYELDPNKDGNGPDDTDNDGIPDYLDTDDDGDGITTRREGADPNGDGNPSDAIDANANGIPDYLEVGNFNPNIPDDEIEVFNYVSSNSDGKNDVLVLGRIFEFPENTVEIYNRWGVLVYETKGYGTRNNYFRGYSDGRVTISKDDKLPSGTYFYVIKYRSGINLKRKAGYLFLQQQ